jgi:hypothetical protein
VRRDACPRGAAIGPAGRYSCAPAGPAFARAARPLAARARAHPAALHAPPSVSCSYVCQCALCVLACGGHAGRGGGMDTVPQPRPPARVPATAAGCACQGYCFTGVTGRCPCMKAGRTCTPESCQGCTQVRSLCLPTVCACVRVCVRPAWCRGPVNQARRTPGTAACGVPGPLAPRPPHPIRWVVAVLPWCRRKSARP